MASKLRLSLLFFLSLFSLFTPPALAATPLEQAGLTPVWSENFPDMTIPNMQWTRAYSQGASKMNNFVIPGAVHLGQTDAFDWGTETMINHFKMSPTEPQTKTVEFDLFLTKPASSRIFVRAHLLEAGVFIFLHNDSKTQVAFYDNDDSTNNRSSASHDYVPWTNYVGANKWAHVVVSLSQNWPARNVEAVVAINGEVKQRTMKSYGYGDLATYWQDDGEKWIFEFNGGGPNTGYYMANFRGYEQFMDKATLESKLGNVNAYLSTLSLPNQNTFKNIVRSDGNYTYDGTPTALAVIQSQSGNTFNFNGSYSAGKYGIKEYKWDFGDGQSAIGKFVSHTFAPRTEAYNVTLTAKSRIGQTNSHTITIYANGALPSPTAPAAKPGDANGDGQVNEADYTVWLNHYRQNTTKGPLDGDYNSNGIVDGVDYAIWLTNYGR